MGNAPVEIRPCRICPKGFLPFRMAGILMGNADLVIIGTTIPIPEYVYALYRYPVFLQSEADFLTICEAKRVSLSFLHSRIKRRGGCFVY